MERNTDPAMAEIASARAAQLLIDLAGAKYVGTAKSGSPITKRKVKISIDNISKFIGYKYSIKQVKDALTVIGGKVSGSSNLLSVEVPSWRSDLVTSADFSEEIARINGYELIPSKLPIGKSGAGLNAMQMRKRQISTMLANQGFSEVINYPFVSQKMVETLGFTGDRAKSFRVANPMSEEFPLLRTHLIPGLISTMIRNIGRGMKDIAIFEIGTVFRNSTPLGKAVTAITNKRPSAKTIAQIYDGVPKQMLFVAAVVSGEKELSSWQGSGSKFTWNDAVAKAVEIVEATGNSYEIGSSDLAPWHPGRCAEIKVNGKVIAHAGELHPRVISELDLPERSCAFAVIISELPQAPVTKAPKIWTMPAVVQDVALVVSSDVGASQVEAALRIGAGSLLESITLFDRYDQIGDGKVSLAFTLTFRASDRTLTADEVASYRDQAVTSATRLCGATLRG
jgi:phenylalanyl-tRNA synthetase beta chain